MSVCASSESCVLTIQFVAGEGIDLRFPSRRCMWLQLLLPSRPRHDRLLPYPNLCGSPGLTSFTPIYDDHSFARTNTKTTCILCVPRTLPFTTYRRPR